MNKKRKTKYIIGGLLILILVAYSVGVASQLIQALFNWLGGDGGFAQGFNGLSGLSGLDGLVSGATSETWTATDITQPTSTITQSASLNIGHPLHALTALLNTPYNLYGFVVIAILAGLIIIFLKKNSSVSGVMDNERNFVYSDKGTYGTAGWMTDDELRNELEVTNDLKRVRGTILGELDSGKTKSIGKTTNKSKGIIKGFTNNLTSSIGIKGSGVVCVPEDTMMNRNVAVYGAAGSMKSRAYVRNMVFQSVRRGDSLIVTDPKSELYASTAEYLRNNGYIVRVFNLISPENSDSWNCLREIEGDNQELMAQIFCDVVIRNTLLNGKMDPFWDTGAIALLKALCLYVVQVYPEENRNIGEVYKMLANIASSGGGSGSGSNSIGGVGSGSGSGLSGSGGTTLRAAFSALPFGHSAKAPFEIFQQASDSVQSGIIIGLANRIQVFQIEALRMITSHSNGIDLTLPGKQKCAYFCITSDQDSTFDFLSSLFLSFMFIKLVRFADSQPNQCLPLPVHLLADELANIGVIPDLTKKISTVRSRKISMSVIFQNIAQMQNRYPDNQWLEIIGNCDTQLFLGCTDELTAKFISDRTGEVTIGVESTAKEMRSLRFSNYVPSQRETSSIGKRKLLTPDEVLRLPRDDALVIFRGQKVLKVKKFDYTKHPEAKKLRDCNARDYVPNWRMVDDGLTGNENPTGDKGKLVKPSAASENTIENTIDERSVAYSQYKIIPKVKARARNKVKSAEVGGKLEGALKVDDLAEISFSEHIETSLDPSVIEPVKTNKSNTKTQLSISDIPPMPSPQKPQKVLGNENPVVSATATVSSLGNQRNSPTKKSHEQIGIEDLLADL